MAKSRRRKKKSSAAKNVAIFFIVFVLLEGLLIYGLKTVFKNENSVATLAGYSFFIMDSDNMGQDCPKDSLVIAVNGVPSSDKCGFTVLARNVENQGTTVGWLYEVGAKGDTVDHVVYTIYQEKSPDKMYDLTSADIVGQATSYYLTAGKIISFMITPFGMAVCLAAPIVLMILILLIIAIANRSDSYDLSDFEEMERQHDAQQNANMSLDDFLYGGENDEVYSRDHKPSADYSEEFDDSADTDPVRKIAPQADPFFGFGEQADEEDIPAPAPQADAEPEAEPETEEDAAPFIPKEFFNRGAAAQPVSEPEPEADAEPEPEPEPEQIAEPEAPEIEVEVEPEEVSEPEEPAVDPSYYEKASRMIDDAVSAKPEAPEAVETSAPAVEEPAPRPQRRTRPQGQRPAQGQQRRRPPQRPAGAPPRRRPPQARPHRDETGKNSAATIDELMKLMEEEQKKLKGGNNS